MIETAKSPHDVFISYSSKNKNIADAVVSEFEQHGIRCWYAPRDIRPGEEWVTAITGALEKAKVLVLIFTDESNSSRQVMNEVAVAFNAGLTIVPFRLSDEQMSSELEYYLTRVHWLDAVSKPLRKNIVALREYIEVIINAPGDVSPSKAVSTVNTESEVPGKRRSGINKLVITCIILGVLIIAGFIFSMHFIRMRNEDLKNTRYLTARKEYWGESDVLSNQKTVDDLTELTEYFPDAYYYLGKLSEREYDPDSAIAYYEKGVDEGSMLALTGLGNIYLNGTGVEEDRVKAKECFDNAYFAGCTEAGYYEAYMWYMGLIPGEDSNPGKALEYLDAAMGSEDAEIAALSYILKGDIRVDGYDGEPMTGDEAEDYFPRVKDICSDYESESYCHIGRCYYRQEYYALAIDWYRKAAELGNRYAMKIVGDMTTDGLGTEMDDYSGRMYYLMAGGFTETDNEPYILKEPHCLEDEDMFNRLGLSYFYDYDYERAAYFFTLEAETFGSVNGMGNAGMAYENLMDWDNALKWYGAAIDAGHPDADRFRRRIRIMADDGLVDRADAGKWI